ncbi:MAG: stage V sporulation protein AD, partial [Syntrophomonadaceae bacterium]|nr:stage V sporulation protein AD [Syntrophomonadaceae bacterium]
MLQGHQSWVFSNRPHIVSTGTVVGPFEAQVPLAMDFDLLHENLWLEQGSYEKAERKILEQACHK